MNEQNNNHNQEYGRHANIHYVSPTQVGIGADNKINDSRQHIAQGRNRLHNAQCGRAGISGKGFRHQGRTRRKFAANAQPGQKTEQYKLKRGLRKAAQTCKCRVQENGNRHGFGAAEPVANHPEEQPSRSPSDDHPHLRQAHPIPYQAALFHTQGADPFEPQQFNHCRLFRLYIQPLVHGVEKPSKAGNRKHQIMIARQPGGPALGRL
ncbi:MAG: hypothetical protein BWX80_00914 [Candidatus Hydrogenedentes bacterium ADurb.Bin101]|nr:MAG: hypothetical protein BWX80_00914 [Candidatus Hydrogenedentes bacterium ADurb.Bin101]